MSEDGLSKRPEAVNTALSDMKLESPDAASEPKKVNGSTENSLAPKTTKTSRSPSLERLDSLSSASQTPMSEHEEILGSEIAIKLESGKPPKLSRKSSQKIISRPARLFDHLPNSTPEAISTFQVIRDCIYGSKYMGSSEHDALGCDCSEEWYDGRNNACGEDSDCINRATKMECIDDECNCGSACQNQRFQRKQFANVSVIKTEKKGYGLRTDSDLHANDFIFEYIGEVINEPTFRRRTIQYDEEGIKHFYFMSLTKSEFVDATKKGNLGRFCNHSCNPNCYVDKWVVGDKLRMGIFAERSIKAGEELVFNYNVDRYGADPQPCYCGEPNCTGFIGGKTQTERATKLSHATIEALGIDDGDGWDTAVAKRPRKKKMGEGDEEYVNNLQPKGLDEDGVTKVMATLMQCKEKWIAVKLLSRIQRCNDDRVRNRVVRMHGYQILRTTLTTWIDDNNVVLQILDILYKFPRLTRNKIVDSKIEVTIETLVISEHEDVTFEAKRLLEEWSKLEMAYRIPRKKFDPSAQNANHFDRRGGDREDEASKSPAPTASIVAPTGPRNTAPQRNPSFFAPTRPAMMRRPFNPLPTGWFAATDGSGNTYYYSKSGQTTWQRPHLPAPEPPPPPKAPPKAIQNQKALQDIIDSLTKSDANSHQNSAAGTPQRLEDQSKEKPKSTEKWRSLSQEKQMKLYENTLFPHIKYIMDKFRNKLPKEDLKKFAKEIGKKLVASDFKHNRVEDPTKITDKQEKKVRKYVKEFFDKAVAKKAAHDRQKVPRKQDSAIDGSSVKEIPNGISSATTDPDSENAIKVDEPDDMDLSEDGEEVGPAVPSAPVSPTLNTPSDEGLKRKRDDLGEAFDFNPSEMPIKRLKDEDMDLLLSPPPPPPPPPAEDMIMEMDEEAELAAQEEALMRENEEALMLENEEAMQEAQLRKVDAKTTSQGKSGELDTRVNGIKTEIYDEINQGFAMKEVNGNTTVKLESGMKDPKESVKDLSDIEENRDKLTQHERKEVLSH